MRLSLRNEGSRLLLAAVLFGAGAAGAQDYPDSAETAVLTAWLGKSTNIAPATVVAVTPELVVAIAGKTMPTVSGGPVRLTLREEVIAPGYVQTVGGRSSLMSMELHCDERRIRMDERRLYSGLNLTGAMEISDPSAEWVRIPEGSIMDEVARAACEPEYAWPLGSGVSGTPVSSMTVAALETPTLLPPGPDARLVADEPPVEEISTVVAPPVVPEPEVVPPLETAVVASTEVEAGPAVIEQVSESAIEIAAAPGTETAPPADAETATEQPPAPGAIAPQGPSSSPPPELVAAEAEEIGPSSNSAPVAEPVEVAVAPPEVAPPAPIETPPAEAVAALVSEPPAPAEPEVAAPATAGPVFAVQIGAYEIREAAQEAWLALSAGRPVLVDGLGFEIRPARVKGKNWLRGLVGRFATRKEAAAFCTAIAGSEYGCIVRALAH